MIGKVGYSYSYELLKHIEKVGNTINKGGCPMDFRELTTDVLVIGGGDTGNDCVGTAIRQGCESVMQLEMMPCPPAERTANNAWPEWPRVLKTDYGQQEAIAKFGNDPRVYQTTVKEFSLLGQSPLSSLLSSRGMVSGSRPRTLHT